MSNPTKAEIASVLAAANAVVGAIKEAGPMGAPAGLIYAALMAQGVTLTQYQGLERLLIRTGLVTKRGDVLYAKAA